MKNNKWSFICPCCKEENQSSFSRRKIRANFGATINCPKCGSVLKIEKDYTCSDFGEYLVERYKEAGVQPVPTKEESIKSYIEC
jgi:uncharacterized C2H2 Zn-finger protein